MRIDLTPIIEEGRTLIAAIEVKSLSRSIGSADRLQRLLPPPNWAETAPGCSIYYHGEKELNDRLNALRRQAMIWTFRLIDESISQESDDEWPAPANLKLAIERLLPDQNASSSVQTAPTAS